MHSESNQRDFYFLNGDSEMTNRIRQKDWSQTPIGNPTNWPASLKTMVGTILENPFPAYIAWGPSLTQFYNDGYIPVLGSIKHPDSLGMSTKDTFTEAWYMIEPMFQQVLEGKPILITDGHFQLYRNGYLEDCYFDFAYSPIRQENGEIGGILVTVIETTNRKLAMDRLTESEGRFKLMAENSDFLIVIAEKSGKPSYFNKSCLKLTGKSLEDLLGVHSVKVIHPHDRFRFIKTYSAGLRAERDWSGEFQVLNHQGTYSWLFAQGTCRFNQDQSFAGYVISSVDITQRKESEQRLQNNEKVLRSIIDSSPFPIGVLMGKDLKVEFANRAILDAWGKGPDVIDKKFKEILPELTNQGVFGQIDRVVETGIPFLSNAQRVEMEIQNRREVRFYNSSFNPIKNDSGETIGIFNTGVEVTDLVLAKQKVEEAEAKARLAIDSADLGVYEMTYATSEFITDRRFHEICGYDSPQSLQVYRSMLHPEDLDIREEAHIEAFATGRLEYQCRIIWPDHSVHWVRVTGRIIYDENQVPVKLTGITQDITATILAQQRIEESERTMRNMVLQAPVAMCIFRGSEYIVEIANKKMIELWGHETDAIIGNPIFEGLPEAKEQGLEELLQMVATTGERFIANERPVFLPRDGKLEKVFVNFVYEPIVQKTGDRADIMAIAIDVSPQVKARHKIEEVVAERTRDLAKAIIELRQSNEDLAQFAYIASHDLQEPIRKITSFSEMLKNQLEGNLDELSALYLDKIINASSRMSKLIRDVLTYSETGKKTDEIKTVNLNSVVTDVIADFELLIEQKGAIVTVGELPELEAIPLQMTQLFGNLISNALKFSRKDTAPRIKIEAKLSDLEESKLIPLIPGSTYYHIQVTDNGIGFRSEYGEQIFSIFQRLHRKTDFAGTGIGLSMCKKIAQNHHGEINSKGSSESGAIFNIYLPAKQHAVE